MPSFGPEMDGHSASPSRCGWNWAWWRCAAPYRNHTCLSDRPDSSAQADEIQAAARIRGVPACHDVSAGLGNHRRPLAGVLLAAGRPRQGRHCIRLPDQHGFGNCGAFRVGSDAALPGMAALAFLARPSGASGGGRVDHARGYGAGLRGTRGVLRANPWRGRALLAALPEPLAGLRQRWRSLSRSAGLCETKWPSACMQGWECRATCPSGVVGSGAMPRRRGPHGQLLRRPAGLQLSLHVQQGGRAGPRRVPRHRGLGQPVRGEPRRAPVRRRLQPLHDGQLRRRPPARRRRDREHVRLRGRRQHDRGVHGDRHRPRPRLLRDHAGANVIAHETSGGSTCAMRTAAR